MKINQLTENAFGGEMVAAAGCCCSCCCTCCFTVNA